MIEVQVLRSARRRTMALQVGHDGRVCVRAPLHVAPRELDAFVARHEGWIRRKVGEAAARPQWQPVWAEGGEWYWQGGLLRLQGGGRRGGEVRDGALRLPVDDRMSGEEWRRLVLAWHRRAAGRLLADRAQALFALHCGSHRLHAIELRWMKSTWGTCTGRRAVDGRRDVKLRLNPWLASLPPHLCDAILLHELAHVEHMNHGPGFYRRLAQMNPSWREHDAELKPWSNRLLPVRLG